MTPYTSLGDFTLGLGRGIYSDSQLEQHRRYRVALTSRRPVLAKVANAAILRNGEAGAGRLGITLDLGDMPFLALSVAGLISPSVLYLRTSDGLCLGIHDGLRVNQGHPRMRHPCVDLLQGAWPWSLDARSVMAYSLHRNPCPGHLAQEDTRGLERRVRP